MEAVEGACTWVKGVRRQVATPGNAGGMVSGTAKEYRDPQGAREMRERTALITTFPAGWLII
jgi:hypothetical protein